MKLRISVMPDFMIEEVKKKHKKQPGQFSDHPLSELEFSENFQAGGCFVSISAEVIR